MARFFRTGGHYLTGLAIIAAVAALIAIGKVTEAVGMPVMVGVATALIGGQLGLNQPAAPTPPKAP